MHDEYDETRWFIQAMQAAFKDSDVQITTSPELDRQAVELVLEAVLSRSTVREATRSFLDFIEMHHMAKGSIPDSLFATVERTFIDLRPAPMLRFGLRVSQR